MVEKHMVQELNEKNFESFYKKGLVVIDFFAEWCMPCNMMAPIMEELNEKFKGKVKFGKMDISENEAIAEKYGISSIPAFIIFQNGKIVKEFMGLTSSEDFSEILEDFLR